MNGKRMSVWLAVVMVVATVMVRWQLVEAYAPPATYGSTSDVTLALVRNETRTYVLAYESKLHGNRPVAEGAEEAQSDATVVLYTSDRLREESLGAPEASREAEQVLSTSDRLREESLGAVTESQNVEQVLSTSDRLREEHLGESQPTQETGIGRAERTEW